MKLGFNTFKDKNAKKFFELNEKIKIEEREVNDITDVGYKP